MKEQAKPATPEQVITMLNKALLDGTLKITRSLTYRKKLAPTGMAYYKLYYRVDDKIVYEGAYTMPRAHEDHLKHTGTLNTFLITQLATELT